MIGPEERPGGLRLTIAGVPVTIRVSIVLLLAVLGLGFGSVAGVALWVGIGVASIVLHELGHALVARRAGAEPTIELAGLGGVTRYRASGPAAGRRWRLLIALAGPFVGIAVGLAVLAVRLSLDPDPGLFDTGLRIALFTSFGWSAFNLLPILPLDGGQAMQQLLPGDEDARTKLAAWIGTGVSVAVTLAAIAYGQLFLALFGGFFVAQNVATARSVDRMAEASRQLAAATVGGDWNRARGLAAAGAGDEQAVVDAQVAADAAGAFQQAAELGEVAMMRGAQEPEVALRTSRAWARLGATGRAQQAFRRAVDLGADQALIDAFATDDEPGPPPPPVDPPPGA